MAALSGGERCIKYLMFAFNLVFWLAGTAVLAVGLWLKLDSKTNSLLQGENSPYVFYTGVYVLIAVGAVMMVVGFLGCCGAIQESPLMLGLFFSFLLIIFAVEIAAGFWGFSNQNKVLDLINGFYRQTYEDYSKTRDDGLKETLRLIQNELYCCGLQGRIGETYPDLCPPAEDLDMFIIKSCPDVIDEVFNSKLHIVGGIGITIGVIMVFGLIFTMLLCCAIRKSREVV
ncbi:CD9 molecule a isoform X1 [Poecilia reticulata]|uniref:Tetraspanin n=1 Tax=Poecilia reticulata TaxID=8081 RepID=A0A3P9NGN2_POERE|nr:PREDICTED: CD9 antigen-like isoform X1 [Poecilia reticulata]